MPLNEEQFSKFVRMPSSGVSAPEHVRCGAVRCGAVRCWAYIRTYRCSLPLCGTRSVKNRFFSPLASVSLIQSSGKPLLGNHSGAKRSCVQTRRLEHSPVRLHVPSPGAKNGALALAPLPPSCLSTSVPTGTPTAFFSNNFLDSLPT